MTVGERLREARERQKVSLHAIAEKTNISVRFLDAIEKNQFDKLPGGIFTRGFIRSYAAQVGLDPDGAVDQFLSDEPSQRDDDIDVAPLSSREGVGVGALMLGGLAVLLAALVLVYFLRPGWIGLSPVAPTQDVASAEPAAAGNGADSVPSTSTGPGGADTTVPAPLTPAPPAATPAAPVESATEGPTSPLRLVVAPTGRCWVQVSADGQMRVAREIAAGERVTVDAAERLQITVGNAGSFSYELNGRPGKSLGAPGQVARATIVPATVPQFQAP